MYVVLRGAARFTLGDEQRELVAGEVAAYPDPWAASEDDLAAVRDRAGGAAPA